MANQRSTGLSPIVRWVAGALIRHDRVLLVKRSPQSRFYPGIWDLFGGHVEEKESPEDALRREALEELQVEIDSFRRLGSVPDPVEPAEIMVFAVFSWIGEPINAAPNEHSQIGWFEADALPDYAGLDIHRELKEFILAALAISSECSVD